MDNLLATMRWLGARTQGKLGPQALSCPNLIGYHEGRFGWQSTFTKIGKEEP
jgi:hypothetical protein